MSLLGGQSILLKSDLFEVNAGKAFRELMEDTVFTDVTLVSNDGQMIHAHKVVLISSSTYFKTIMEVDKNRSEVIVNIAHVQLMAIVKYIYTGEVRVLLDHMKDFMEAGQILGIQGLVKVEKNDEALVGKNDSSNSGIPISSSLIVEQSEIRVGNSMTDILNISKEEVNTSELFSRSNNFNEPISSNLDTRAHQDIKKDKIGVSRYPCDHCEFSSKFKRYLIAHRGKEHPELKVQCDECGYMGTEAGYKQHQLKHKGQVYTCDQCDYRTPVRYRLNEHIKNLHTKEYNYCDKCVFKTVRNSVLKKHVETEHNGVLSRCDMCELSFKIPTRLEDHKRYVHEGILYNCDQCAFTAIHRGIMNRHIRRAHMMIRYPCNYCAYQATERGNLKDHIQGVHLNIKRKYRKSV